MRSINLRIGTEKITTPLGDRTPLAASVDAALAAVNDRARDHTYTDARDIFALAADAERRLESLGIPRHHRTGAVYVSTSGGPVPNAYKYSRRATSVTLKRRASGWTIASITRTEIYKKGGRAALILTQDQDALAVKKLRSTYHTTTTTEPTK